MPTDTNSPDVVEGLNDDEAINRSVIIFGRDVSKIPCFKESFLYGLLGGIGCGLVTFMSTSRVGKSTNIAVYSFCGITLIYWFNCRLNWSRSKFTLKQTQRALQEYDHMKGTGNYSSSTGERQD